MGGKKTGGPGVREAILAAAEAEFAEKGFAGAGIKDIARRAGVADGTIYNYFPGKDALLEELAARFLAAFGAAESVPLEAKDGGLESRVLERMKGMRDAYRAAAAVLPVVLERPRLRESLRAEFVEPAAAMLRAEFGAGALEARTLAAAALGFQVLLLIGDGPAREAWEDPRQLAQVWAKVIRALAGPDGPR